MPAFDPVRDAVLNSPVEQTHSPRFSHPLPSPSLARRATDLSVLLNTEAAPSTPPAPPHPPLLQRAHPSTLSHLLHASTAPPNSNDDKLAATTPFRRSSFHQSDSPESHFTYLSDSRQLVQRSPSPSRLFPESPRSRPSTSSSQTQPPSSTARTTTSPSMPPPPPSTSTIPYNPKKRITPATSVLVPLSPAEMHMFKNYCGKGTARLRKRKRKASEELESLPSKRHAGDVGVVVEHYNSRPDVGVVQRQESPIIGLKNFNNWVKSVLITTFAHPILEKSSYGQGRNRGKVLDLGCGKGGDLNKWLKARIRELMCVDIAAISIDQARSRWEGLRAPKFDASFAALDCYSEPITKAFLPEKFFPPFDVVSMQFCMHYAFETSDKARCMLENVTRHLRSGGVFIGTIPNAEILLDQLDAMHPDAKELSFGNDVYTIRFEERNERPLFGHRYWFFLQDAVENVPEYVVQWDNFVRMASDYGLNLIYKKEFHEVFEENREHTEFGPLLLRMKVMDANGESAMDEHQWEAANLYIAFAFQKR